jgi:hypothetical protein
LLVILLALLSIACSTAVKPNSQARCEALGGQWAARDRNNRTICTVTGQRCADDSECKAGCLAPLNAEEGEQVSGVCGNPEQVSGLYTMLYVVKGRVVRMKVVD